MNAYSVAALVLGIPFSLAGLVVLLVGALRTANRYGDREPPARLWIVATALLVVGASWLVDIR